MIHDITPTADSDLSVWPGDSPLQRKVLLDMGKGDNLTLSTLTCTVHLGAHTDAPSHYGANASSIAEVPLEPYLGPCHVVDVKVGRNARISAGHFEVPAGAERILFRTGTFPDPTIFNEDFAAIEPELVRMLGDLGVKLVGIDTPSVDLFASKELPAHLAFLEKGMAILEGIVLTDVPPGPYELIALPLKLAGFDASPVRAVLRSL